MAHYKVPYGESELEFDLSGQVDVANLPPLPESVTDFDIPAIDIGDNERAIIIFTDATRHSPDRWFAQKILKALPLPAEKITFLCAIGMHRPSTPVEKVDKLGADIVQQYRVIDHNPAEVITAGEIDGIPVEVNPLLAEPGTLVIMTGVVEPHQYAGYSGGAKTAVIGCGGVRTIGITHGTKMLDKAGVRLGQIDGNPFQEFVRKAGKLIGVDIIVNAVMPVHDTVTHVAFGGMSVHDDLVKKARQLYETPVPHAPYDIVITGVSPPKDANLYQASRAATYIGLSSTPVLRRGGVIILPAALPEGAGQGTGEKNFFEILQKFGSGEALIHHLQTHDSRPGEQRAYMIAQMLRDYACIVVGAKNPNLVRSTGLHSARTMDSALQRAGELTGQANPSVLIVPDALKVLPRPA